ncbi:MAG: PQQ-like beta-propeller repeat protein, partial [Planctomycetota bacterium]|nr:PQQ-like beta-propeller repeat protein [Planctomycetota bacterium]
RKGHIFCLDAAKGAVVWQADAKQLGVRNPTWDLSGSPLLYGNLVIYNLNASGVALEKTTGKVAWKSAAGAPGYATPVPFDINGMKGVCIFGANQVCGINPADGKVGWSFPWQSSHNVAAVDPVFFGDKVFISTGYGVGCAGLQIAGGQAKKLWQNKEISAHISNGIGQNGVVYGIDGQTGGNSLKCLEIATGAVKWTQNGVGGTMIMVDGKLVILSTGGNLTVAEATPAGYKQLASAKVMGGTCWTQPTFVNGKLFARNKEGDLVCLNLSGK